MHCHVLQHMADGMMGSLLIVDGGDPAPTLPEGVLCPSDHLPGDGVVLVQAFQFIPREIHVPPDSFVTFEFNQSNHTVTTTAAPATATRIEINGGNNTASDSQVDVRRGEHRTVRVRGNPGDIIEYMCGIHNEMTGKIIVTEPVTQPPSTEEHTQDLIPRLAPSKRRRG